MANAGRLYEVSLTSALNTGRLYEVSLSSPTIAANAGRLYDVSLTTPPFTSVSLGPARTVDSLDLVTIDATWTGATPTTFTWSVVSNTTGTTATLTPDGDQLTFYAPPSLEGGVVRIGLTTFNGSSTSALATVDITVYPQLEWVLTDDVWIPYSDEVIAL